jgi:hypothetical protein
VPVGKILRVERVDAVEKKISAWERRFVRGSVRYFIHVPPNGFGAEAD